MGGSPSLSALTSENLGKKYAWFFTPQRVHYYLAYYLHIISMDKIILGFFLALIYTHYIRQR